MAPRITAMPTPCTPLVIRPKMPQVSAVVRVPRATWRGSAMRTLCLASTRRTASSRILFALPLIRWSSFLRTFPARLAPRKQASSTDNPLPALLAIAGPAGTELAGTAAGFCSLMAGPFLGPGGRVGGGGRLGGGLRRAGVPIELLTGLDVRVLLDALLVLGDLPGYDAEHPPHVQLVLEQVEPFAGIAAQVEEHWEARLLDCLVDALAVAEDRLDVVPLTGHERAVWAEEQQRRSSRLLASPEQEVRGVDTVHRPVGGHLARCPGERCEGLVPVVG